MPVQPVAVTHISPLSAFKVALAMSFVGLVSWLIAVSLLYIGMETVGIWDSINGVIGDVGGGQTITFGMVIALGGLLGIIVAVLMSVLAPIMALIYNGIVGLFAALEVDLESEA